MNVKGVVLDAGQQWRGCRDWYQWKHVRGSVGVRDPFHWRRWSTSRWHLTCASQRFAFLRRMRIFIDSQRGLTWLNVSDIDSIIIADEYMMRKAALPPPLLGFCNSVSYSTSSSTSASFTRTSPETWPHPRLYLCRALHLGTPVYHSTSWTVDDASPATVIYHLLPAASL
jgi:hypothetical protein